MATHTYVIRKDGTTIYTSSTTQDVWSLIQAALDFITAAYASLADRGSCRSTDLTGTPANHIYTILQDGVTIYTSPSVKDVWTLYDDLVAFLLAKQATLTDYGSYRGI